MTWCAAKQNDFPIQFVAFPEVQAAVVRQQGFSVLSSSWLHLIQMIFLCLVQMETLYRPDILNWCFQNKNHFVESMTSQNTYIVDIVKHATWYNRRCVTEIKLVSLIYM